MPTGEASQFCGNSQSFKPEENLLCTEPKWSSRCYRRGTVTLIACFPVDLAANVRAVFAPSSAMRGEAIKTLGHMDR